MSAKLPVTISFGEEVYRTAGYRIPNIGDLYVSKTGRIAKCTNPPPFPEARLIVRLFDAEKDFQNGKVR